MLYPVIMMVSDDIKMLKGKEKVEALSRIARHGAGVSAKKSALPLPVFEKDGSGVPMPSEGVFWSISHKPDVVAGVVSNENVGIDVEMIRPVSDQLFNRIVSRDEHALFLQQEKDRVFFRIFTAKEAVLKATGDGIKGLSNVKIVSAPDENNLCAAYLNQKYFVENFYGDGYLASVTKKACAVQWTVV